MHEENRYTMEEFADQVQEHLKDFLPGKYSGWEIRIEQVFKTNERKTALTVFDPDKKERSMSPVIYLDGFYEDYRNGESMEMIMGRIMEKHQMMREFPQKELTDKLNSITDHLGSWDEMKGRLIISVIGRDRNRELLETVPHTDAGDLSAVYRVYVSREENDIASILVTNKIQKMWNVPTEEIHSTALENSMSVLPLRVSGMGEVVTELFAGDDMEEDREISGDESLYVVTNKQSMNGASAIFYPNAAEKIGAIFPNGCYVLPSSIHEVLLCEKGSMLPEELENMVREINRNVVAPNEVLSDRVHEYDPMTRRISLAGQMPEITKNMQAQRALSL